MITYLFSFLSYRNPLPCPIEMSYKMQFDLILILFVGQLPDIKGMFWTLALFFIIKTPPLLYRKKIITREKNVRMLWM